MGLLGVGVLSGEALRWYVRQRRDLMGFTQKSFALEVDIPYATYRDFENVPDREMKSNNLTKVINRLSIPLKHIQKLANPTITQSEAEALAAEDLGARADATAAQITDEKKRSQALEIVSKFKDDPEALAEFVRLINEAGTQQQ